MMFKNERDYILNPLQIKRIINGENLTLDVIETSYEPATKFVLLFDAENLEFYGAYFMDQQFKNIKKLGPYNK